MSKTVTVAAHMIPGTDSPVLRSSRCTLRMVPDDKGCAWVGTLLVSCGEREAVLLVVVKRQGKGWRLETQLEGEEDPNRLSIGIPDQPGAIPAFVTSPWHFLNTDFGVRLVVEPTE